MNKDLDKAWRERLVKNHLDLIILRLLKAKPRWGYEINLEIRDRFKVYLSAGTLYPLLHAMEENKRSGRLRVGGEEKSTRLQLEVKNSSPLVLGLRKSF